MRTVSGESESAFQAAVWKLIAVLLVILPGALTETNVFVAAEDDDPPKCDPTKNLCWPHLPHWPIHQWPIPHWPKFPPGLGFPLPKPPSPEAVSVAGYPPVDMAVLSNEDASLPTSSPDVPQPTPAAPVNPPTLHGPPTSPKHHRHHQPSKQEASSPIHLPSPALPKISPPSTPDSPAPSVPVFQRRLRSLSSPLKIDSTSPQTLVQGPPIPAHAIYQMLLSPLPDSTDTSVQGLHIPPHAIHQMSLSPLPDSTDTSVQGPPTPVHGIHQMLLTPHPKIDSTSCQTLVQGPPAPVHGVTLPPPDA